MVRIFGAWNDDVSGLNVPAQDDLGVGFAVLLTQPGEQRLLDQGLVPVAQGVQAWITMPSLLRNFFSSFSWE